jgi:hypothetical protein
MTISHAEPGDRGFTITWEDQSSADYPYSYLRDNDPDNLHPHTRERIFDLTTIELPIRPELHELSAEGLRVSWPDKQQPSLYSSSWLRRHLPGERRPDASNNDDRTRQTLNALSGMGNRLVAFRAAMPRIVRITLAPSAML